MLIIREHPVLETILTVFRLRDYSEFSPLWPFTGLRITGIIEARGSTFDRVFAENHNIFKHGNNYAYEFHNKFESLNINAIVIQKGKYE